MNYYQASTPFEYQNYFYSNTGLIRKYCSKHCSIWENEEQGFIHIYGSLKSIQFGTGDYGINKDIAIHFDYEDSYLHFGLVYKGTTHIVEDNQTKVKNSPAPFVSIDRKPSGAHHWKKGQWFKGTEVSINMVYLEKVLLPILGEDISSLQFLNENLYYHQTEELNDILIKVQSLLTHKKITSALMTAIALELVATLVHPDTQNELQNYHPNQSEYITLGNRKILFSKEDFQKIIAAHDRLKNTASNFPTVYALSKELGISEQKLKAGFYHLYHKTIWEYANHIRMNKAIELLKDNDNSIAAISSAIGYQSQAAFINMFKKWTGISPSAFRAQNIKNNS